MGINLNLGLFLVGLVLCLVGAGLFISGGDKFDSFEESQLYDGKDGVMRLEGYAGGGWLIVTMEGNYSNGESAIIEGGANLKQEDCDLVKKFTLTGEDSEEYFIPTCDNRDDTTEDGWIHIGVICDSNGKYSNQTKGCPDGTYTWDTNGKLINVWDGEAIIEGLESLVSFGAGLFACCCGTIILLTGIVLKFFNLQDNQPQTFDASSNHPLTSNKDDGFTSYEKKGWDEQEDYIRKDTSEDETTEKEDSEEETKKDRSGEYEMPPPPE